MIARTKRLGLALGILFSCNILAQALIGFTSMEPAGGVVAPGSTTFNDNTTNGTPKASDTVIVKNWEAVETLTTWWDVAWDSRKKVTFTEPGLMDRDREPTTINIAFTGNEARINSIRLTFFRNDSTWVEVPSQILDVVTHTNGSGIAFYTSCSIFFFLNMTKGDTEIYYVYYDPVINTAPAYQDRIDVRGQATAAITDDTVNPSFTHLNGTAYNTVDSLQIAYNDVWATPQAAVSLVDTMRSGSDWGGPACSIYSARYSGTDTLNIGQRVAMSVGEMALQASSAADPFDGAAERINVGPDNPREAWDGLGAIRVLDDGPLFTRIQIQTTDGAYAALAALGSNAANGWYRDAIYGTVSDTGNRGVTGGNGYVKYNITYTFYYYGMQTFAKINLDILAAPQRGPVGSGYPREAANYLRPTNVNFKNYGDWPHLMQIVDGNGGTTTPLDRKAWLGSKYSPDGVTVYNMPIADRRRDYPLQPWTAWYASTGTTNPTIGMMAVTNSIGWEVTSLAVAGIGYNSLLQQILPEGHQGDIFTLQRGTALRYEYYMLTSAGGTNWTAQQDMCRRMNDRVGIAVSSAELFSQNTMFIHTNDRNGNTLLGTRVRLYDSTMALVHEEDVDSIGNVTIFGLADGQYTVRVSFFTPYLLNEYLVMSETLTCNHLIPAQRIVFRNYNCNVANLTFHVVNWARNNEALTGVQIRIRNVTTNALVEQEFTLDGLLNFKLYTTGVTQYNLEFVYGGQLRTANVTNPYTLTANTNLNVGLAIETTAITITAQNSSIVLGQTYHASFYYHLSGNTTARYNPSSLTVSTLFGSGFWTQGVDFTWSVGAGYLVTLNLLSGAGTKLANAGISSAYIHVTNATVETASEKLFLVVNSIGSSIKLTLNDTVASQIQVSRGEQVLLEVDFINGQTSGDILGATVNYTLNSVTTGLVYSSGNYSALIGTTTLPFGTYVVTIQAWLQNFEKAITSIVIIVYARPSSLALSSQGNAFYGEDFTIDIDLTDGINGSTINSLPSRLDANIKGTSIDCTPVGSNGHYTATFAGSDFTSLGVYTVQINWTAPVAVPYYQSVKTTILVRIVERNSIVTYEPVGNVAFGENVQVNLRFEDGINATGISAHTTISSNVTGAVLQDLGSGNYRASFSTTNLGSTNGTYHANISLVYNPAFVPYYESHWVNVKIVVVKRPTQLIADAPAAVEYRQSATFSVYYTDLLNSSRLYGGGRVTITSANTTIVAVLNVDKYDINVNSSQFAGPGVYYVPIAASWIGGSPYYTNNNVLVKITVVQRSSQVSYDSLAPTPYLNNFTFFVNFNDGLNGNPISGATISANLTNPTHITWSMVSPGRYSISINTTEISANLGDHFLRITVTAPGGSPFYANGQIVIRLTTTQRSTALSYSGLQPTPLNVDVTFTISFRDAEKATGIFTGVTVTSPTLQITLTPVNQMNGNYLITVHDTGLLTVGSHLVLINFDAPAASPYYRDNSINITIEITRRSTQIVYSGLVPTSYGEMFDFTVQVQDSLLSTPILGLGAGVFSWNASYTFVGETAGNYRFRISTTQYGQVGSVKYRIDATLAGNYASSYAIIPFTIVNRAVALSQGSLLPVSFGENVVFTVTYADGINSTGLTGHPTYLNTVPVFSLRTDLGAGVYRFTIPASNFAAIGSYSIQVNAVWPGGTAPFYEAATINVPVSIVPRGAGLTADKESNVQFGENMTINISFQDTVNSSWINIPLGQLTVAVIGFSNVTIVKTGTNGIYQAKISTRQLPLAGTYVVSVSTIWNGNPYYYNVSRTVSVVVSQRSSMLYPGGEIYQPRGYNVLFNVSLYYLDVVNGSTISATSNVVRTVSAKNYVGTNIPTVNSTGTTIAYYPGVGWKATFNSAHFGSPSAYAYIVTMQFNWRSITKPFYMNRTITFNITVQDAQTQVVVFGSFVAPSGQNHSLAFQYINSESGQPINGSTVRVNNTQSPILFGGATIWNGTVRTNATHYLLSFNVTALPGSLHAFNITFSKTNFNTVIYVFTLVDTTLASELVTNSIQSNRVLGQNVSMVMNYRYQGSATGILNAVLNVSSNVSSIFWVPAEYNVVSLGNGLYNLTILNTGESALRVNTAGFFQIYVHMYSGTTESRTINVQFEMLQIPTNITRVYFNGTRYTNSLPVYTTQITKNVNITVDYVRLFPAAANITSGALVFVTSSSLSSNLPLTLSGTQYRLVLPVSALGIGTHFLFIIGQRANHQQSTKSIQIIVTQVSTSLTLYLNGTANSSIQVKHGQAINVSALYRNTVDGVYITDGASTVTLTGGSGGTTSWNLTVGGSYWRYVLDSKILGPPASYTMTLSASRADFATSSKVFTIQVVDIPTTLTSVNGSSLSVNWSANFRIYVEYRNYLGQVVTAATVTSSPFANSTGGFDGTRYWLGYNASNFGAPNINNLIVTASRTNRTSQSISFSIDVTAIPTSLATYNGASPSTDFFVYWGDNVDITVRYRDVLHATAIASAAISAGTKNNSIVLVNYASGEYTLRFNSVLLGVPQVYIVSLTFSKANYELKATAITIQVASPLTQLIVSDMSGHANNSFNLVYGQSLSFMVRMRDTIHGVNLNSWTFIANPVASSSGFSAPNWTLTYNGLTPGIYTVSITGQQANYSLAQTLVTIVVDQISTQLRTFALNGGQQSVFSVQWGSTISIVVQYQVSPSGVPINPTLSTVTTTSLNKLTGAPTKNAQNTTFVFDGSRFVQGVYTIIFEANRSNYDDATGSITLTVNTMDTTLSIFNVTSGLPASAFNATWGASVSFDVSYNQTATLNAFATIAGVVGASPAPSSSINSPVTGRLRLTYNTGLFSPGIVSITVTAAYQNRTVRSFIVSLTIKAVSARISTFNSLNVNTTTFNVYWNQSVQIAVVYQAGTLNLTQLSGVVITTSPLTPMSQVNSAYDRVTLTFSTELLLTQVYQVTITASRPNYTVASISVLINVQQRPTGANVYATGGAEQYSFNAYWGDNLLVDVLYRDNLSASSISNAVGTSITSAPTFSSSAVNGQYQRLNYATSGLAPGLYSIIISCNRARFGFAQRVISLNVLAVPTQVSTYNVTSGLPSTSFKATWNTIFSVSVQFDRTYLPAGIPGATVSASITPVSPPTDLGGGRYLFTFNSSRIGSPTIYGITFTASLLPNYATSAASVTIEVLRVNAVLQSYVVAGGLKSQFSIEWGKNLTFTGRYHLTASPFTGLHPTNLTADNFPVGGITLGNVGNGENITMTVNASTFGGTGIFTSTFILSRTNYTESSMLVTIQVVPLEARVNLLMNSTSAPAFSNITTSRQYYVPFENDITIHVQYLTLGTAVPLNGAQIMVRFIERGVNWTNYPGGNNTIVNQTGGYYDLTLDTLLDLGDFGQYSFVVVISKANYTLESEPFYVYPIKLQTRLDIFSSTWVLVTSGQKFTINYTQSFVLYAALYDLSKGAYINTTYGVNYTATMKGITYYPVQIFTNGTGMFRFNTSLIDVDVGTSNFISLTGFAGIYNPSGGSVNLEVKTVPTSVTVYNSLGAQVLPGATIPLNYTQSFRLNVTYRDTLNGRFIDNSSGVRVYAKVYAQEINANYTGNDRWEILFNSSTMPITTGSIPQITIYALYQNYTTASFLFNLWVKEIGTSISVYNDQSGIGGNVTLITTSITANWSDFVTLNVYFNSTLDGLPIAYPDNVQAVLGINPVPVNGTYRPLYGFSQISFDSSVLRGGNTHTIIVTVNKQNYVGVEFRFNLVLREVPTAIYVQNETGYVTDGDTLRVVWSDTLRINVTYQNLITGLNISANGPTIRAVVFGTAIPAVNIGGGLWSIDINTSLIAGLNAGSTPQVLVTAQWLNYSQAAFSFNLQVLDLPANLTLYINGILADSFTISDSPTLLGTLNFTAYYYVISDGSPIPGADVIIEFKNDSIAATSKVRIPLVWNGENYTCQFTLDFLTFHQDTEIGKKFVVDASKLNYATASIEEKIQIKPILVNILQNNIGGSASNETSGLLVKPGSEVELVISLFNVYTGSLFIEDINNVKVRITCPALFEGTVEMVNNDDGTFSYSLNFPTTNNTTYTIFMRVIFPDDVADHYQIDNNGGPIPNQIELSFKAVVTGGGFPEWLFYVLIIALVAVVFYFVLYQVRLKYPPIVRKIHDLSGSVRRGKSATKIPVQKVASREEGIYSEFAKLLNEYSFLQTHAKTMAAHAKQAKQKGYVPPEKDTLAKDFELSVKEKVVDVKSVAPAIFPKEGPKKLTAGPPKAEYVEPSAPAAPVAMPEKPAAPAAPAQFAAPSAPGMAAVPAIPKIPAMPGAPGLVKPVSISIMPKPAAKPLPTKPGAQPSEGEGQEGLYGELVKMEQKKYKAQRSLRDLKAKKEKGILSDEEYEQYRVKFEEALEKINEKIAEIRRKLVNF